MNIVPGSYAAGRILAGESVRIEARALPGDISLGHKNNHRKCTSSLDSAEGPTHSSQWEPSTPIQAETEVSMSKEGSIASRSVSHWHPAIPIR
jgi:hypothetical protein